MEERILLLALRGRDAQVAAQLLARLGHVCHVCRSGDELAEGLTQGAGAALVTEESLAQTDRRNVTAWLQQQPSWSDFPFILMATKRAGRRTPDALAILERLGNVILLERPLHRETLAQAVDSALRGRRRQYEARGQVEALEAAEERLKQLNGTLEERILQRTRQLARANDQLTQEIAERERAQAALVQSQKMEAVGQLTGGIAHDFNNLLTVIAGNLELIERRAGDARLRELAGHASQAADRAAKLTRQLLAFSRSQRLTLRPVDINALLKGMAPLLERTIGPQYTVDLQLWDGEAWAMADANQVELAVLNLAINGRDAMPDRGRLTVTSDIRSEAAGELRSGCSYVVVSVADDGVGIPPGLLQKVFDPFFTTKPVGKGTGLGLSQVYGIARQSGGAARISSVEGAGTTVEIWLPAAAPVHEAPGDLGPRRRAPSRRERILVVEDDPGVRAFMVECLRTFGYDVDQASQGREALARLAAERPALLIVDYAMPGMNGVELVTEARTWAPELPIILATGFADMDAVQTVIPAERVLRKPFKIDDLERAVQVALAATPGGGAES